METNYSWSPNTDILPESEPILDPILPGATGKEEQFSGIGGDRLELSLLPPVVAQPVTPDNIFDGHIQEAIASNLSPPEPLEPPSLARADQPVGARANQEATARDIGLLGEYFHNSNLTNPALTRIDRTVDFIWGKESPDPSMAKETFSARWTGFVQPEFTETYSFITQSDDGVRLWVNGELLIDKWKNQRVTEHSGTISLEAGQLYDITLEYYENKGNAVSKLLWSSASQPQEIIPASRLYSPDIILSTEPEPHPLTLQFITDGFYNPGEAVRFRGKVAGNSDVLVDFSLQKDDNPSIDLEDATVLALDRDDQGYAFFSYELSDLEPGRYQLQALAIDENGNVGETVTQSFQVLDLPPGQELPQAVKRAIAYNSNLENYSPSQLAETREWTVNITGDRTSEALAAEIGAENLGPTGPVANSYIWRFPQEMDPWEVASQLDALQGVIFAYPQVPISLESLLVPNDPYFDRQWHLSKNGEGASVDINVIPAWDLATGDGVAIGIVDDGVQYIHPDLNDSFLPDLSIDLNEADANPDPISAIIIDGGLGEPQPIVDTGYDWTDFPVFVRQKGLVSQATVTFDFDHPFPDELDFYLVSPKNTWLELEDIEDSGSYAIDISFFNGEDATGKWTFVVDDTDRGNQGVLNSLSLGLTIAGAHGTAVAGVAVASGNNSLGVTGVAPDANWAALRLTADAVSDRQIADALYSDDRNQNIQIYNNSWKPQVLWTGVNSLAALDQGISNGRGGLGNIYLFGAGNDWFESRDYRENLNYNAFANSRYTIAVGAIDHTGKKAWYSQEGASLLISAPSGGSRDDSLGITTTDLMGPDGRNADGTGEYGANLDNNDYTNDFDGTSAATPVVSGVIALMLEANPSLSWRDVQHILIQTGNRDGINDPDAGWSGNPTDEIRHSHKYGFGVVDAAAAVNGAASWTPVAPETLISSETITVEKKIPDGNPFGLRRGVKIDSEMTVESVEVVLDITHDFRGDLEIELISPSGEKSLLANVLYDEGDDYNNWVFTSLRHWGESSLGEWQLVVRDKFPGSQGTLHSWQLNLYGTPTTTVSIEATDPIASEDGDPGAFTITRTGDTDNPQIVNYSVTGTATASIDYEALTGTVEIPAGSSSAQVNVIPQDDDGVEGNETVFVVIDAGDGYAIGFPDGATVTITDDDVANNPPTLTLIDPLTGAIEGKSFTISYDDLMAKSNADDADGDPISWEISTIASGILMKEDLAVVPGVTTLSEGEAVVWTPNTFGDEVTAFAVRAFDGKDYSSEPVPVLVSVAAEPIVTISATDANASEDGDSGEFTVARSGDTTESLSVSFSTAGDATAGSDYSTIGEIVIPAGSSEVTVAIDPIDDDEAEGDETVEVVLNADGGYNIGTESSATVTIADNDIVLSTLPVANNDFAIAITGKSVTIPVLESDSDPNGDTLSITGVSTTTNGGTATIFDNGTSADSSDDQIIYTGGTTGVTDTFTYTITDGNGGTSTARVSVGVFADAAGTARAITGDANNNVLVGSDGIAVNEELNGGSGDDILIGRGGSDQLTGNAGADEFRFLAVADSGINGIDVITDFDPITEQDTIGLAFKANSTGVSVTSLGISGFFNLTIAGTSFNITILTDPTTITDTQILNAIEYGSPVANNDFAIAITGKSVTIPVLDSDSDPNGDTLSITGVSTPTNGNASIFNNGTTADSSDDQIVYTGTTAGVTDTFTYTITDGNGGTDTATVSVGVFADDGTPRAITGDANNNVIVGSNGTAFNEALNGGSGDDILIGRGGGDLLTGNAGADEFRFLAAADSGTDVISDFDPSEGDTIGLAFQANSTGVSVNYVLSDVFDLTIAGTSFSLGIVTEPAITDAQILNAIEYGSPVASNEPTEPFSHNQKILAQDAASDSYFGRSLALDGDRLIVGSNGSQDNGDFSGAAYLMNISTGQQTKKLIAPDALPHDNFGWSVAVDGDYALVGAFGSNDQGESSGSAYLFDSTNGNYIREFIADDGSNLDNFGFSVAIDGNHALIGSRWDSDRGTYSGSAYLFDVTTGEQLYKFTASDGASRDQFGWSLALHGNYALFGSRYDDDKGEDSGSAYLFDITTREQLHKFTASDGASEDFFGYSVALNGETALIGAYGDDDRGAYTGAAYQFDLATGEQLRKITAPDSESWDGFGNAVAIDENSNSAVISSKFDDTKGVNSGAAYLFDLDSGEFQHKFVASDGVTRDFLGESVAISGNAVVIGTIEKNDFGNNSGAVYLYSQTEPIAQFNNPTPPDPSADHEPVEPYPLSPKIIAPDGETNEFFGNAVAIEGNKALIGAYQDDDKGTKSGSAYLFDLTSGEELHKFIASDGNSYKKFGNSVAMEGNYALIGSYEDSGAAYLFDTNTGEQLRKFIAPDGASLDQFGWSVALDGNYALIGSKWDEDNGPYSGSAYLFDITTGDFLQKFIAPDGVTDAQFGWSVALAGDKALIGAIWDDDQGEKSGSAYLFDINSGALVKKYLAPDGAADDTFGNAVAMNGNYALIGSRGDTDNGGWSGSAYLFDITTGTQLGKFIAPDGASGDTFGHSVALNGNYAAIGAWGDDDNGENSGSTYLFDITTGDLVKKIVPEDGEIEDNFGRSVALNDNSVLIGAYLDDVRGSDSGSAYLYPIE